MHKKIIYRIGALAVIIAIAAAMFVIGRGHTVYFDNKSGEYNGQEFTAPYRIDVIVNGEKVAKLKKNERGMAGTMGQNFSMQLVVTKEKDGEPQNLSVALPLPYDLDGIVLNLPAMLAGLPRDAYMEEFIPLATAEEEEDEEVITDETESLMGGFGDEEAAE